MSNNIITAWQHYVPRMYLKNFGKIFKKKDKTIASVSFYQFGKDLLKSDVSTESICAQEYFYDKDNSIEKRLADLEKEWSVWLDMIANEEIDDHNNYNKDMTCILKSFAVYQYMRTSNELQHAKDIDNETAFSIFMEENPEYVDKSDNVRTIFSRISDEKVQANFLVEMASKLTREIDDLDIKIIRNKTGVPFITSDVPVILTNAFERGHSAGLSDVGTVLMFPVSDWYLVVLYDGRFYGELVDEIVDERDIVALNEYQFISADERIIARARSSLELLIDNKNLIAIRKNCKNKCVVNSATAEDGAGKILNLKSSAVAHFKSLSFLSIPKMLMKIPVESREAFPRKYEREHRDLLALRADYISMIYKKIVGDEMTGDDCKKIQNGYKTLLEYMDDYWKVPEEERTKLDRSSVRGIFYKMDE